MNSTKATERRACRTCVAWYRPEPPRGSGAVPVYDPSLFAGGKQVCGHPSSPNCGKVTGPEDACGKYLARPVAVPDATGTP